MYIFTVLFLKQETTVYGFLTKQFHSSELTFIKKLGKKYTVKKFNNFFKLSLTKLFISYLSKLLTATFYKYNISVLGKSLISFVFKLTCF